MPNCSACFFQTNLKVGLIMRNIKLLLEYDGTNYHGWQRQNNGITIQECIENSLFRITGEKTSVIGCGRTDAKVHALEYVCNFFTNSKIPTERFPYALNSLLPRDIIVLRAFEAEKEFHSRFSAREKIYIYKILNNKFGSVFKINHSLHVSQKLAVEKMQRAAKYFLGEHDFVAFMATGGKVKSTIRTIYYLNIIEKDDNIEIEISANGFLYNMVRIIVGTLIYVGIGKISPEEIIDIIKSKDRKKAGITVMPQGLYLKKVIY